MLSVPIKSWFRTKRLTTLVALPYFYLRSEATLDSFWFPIFLSFHNFLPKLYIKGVIIAMSELSAE